jgi:sugar lactone lactonase YvrE
VLNVRGDLYIADSLDHRIRRVDGFTGLITTVVGTGSAANGADVLMPGTACAINNPTNLAIDRSGNVYITDNLNHKIRVWYASTALVKTYAGTGTAGLTGEGGQATSALLNNPFGLTFDSSQNLYVADCNNFAVKRIASATGIITTVVGTNGVAGSLGDGGVATSAKLVAPVGVTFDSSGSMYIADLTNNKIRVVANFVFGGTNNIIRTFAGTGVAGLTGDGGLPTSAQFNGLRDVAVDADGNVFTVDAHRVRQVNKLTGLIGLVAGSTMGYDGDGYYRKASLAKLNTPLALTIDPSGGLYISDTSNHVVRHLAQPDASAPGDPSSLPSSLPTQGPSTQPTSQPSQQVLAYVSSPATTRQKQCAQLLTYLPTPFFYPTPYPLPYLTIDSQRGSLVSRLASVPSIHPFPLLSQGVGHLGYSVLLQAGR